MGVQLMFAEKFICLDDLVQLLVHGQEVMVFGSRPVVQEGDVLDEALIARAHGNPLDVLPAVRGVQPMVRSSKVVELEVPSKVEVLGSVVLDVHVPALFVPNPWTGST